MFKHEQVTTLNTGIDLRGLTGGVNLDSKMCEDAQDMLPRADGAAYKIYGWTRKHTSALTGEIVAIKSFNYQGKNTDAGDTRAGNLAIANDGNNFTRRSAIWSGIVVLTDTTFYFWNPGTEAFVIVALPAGAVDIRGKPSLLVYNSNLYIVGWADQNWRWDPTDRALYRWGWESVPGAPGLAASGAGGSLINGAVYQYAYTWVDFYTGEETALGASASITATATGEVTLTLANYAGARRTVGAGTAKDSGIVVYRTEADRSSFKFLAIIDPNTTTLVDNGLSTDASVTPFRGVMQDEPRFDAMVEYQDQFYAFTRTSVDPPNQLSGETGGLGGSRSGRSRPRKATGGREAPFNRIFFNDFGANSWVERWPLLNFRTVPLSEGESITAFSKTFQSVIVYTEKRANLLTNVGGSIRLDPLPWEVGCVGPQATEFINGWTYFLSERGPARWREGLAAPQDIGRNIESQFIDSTSGLCKLNAADQHRSEVFYDPDSKLVRFIFPCGSTDGTLNRHWGYWIDSDRLLGDYTKGWWSFSPRAQAFDYSNSLAGLQASGEPQEPTTRKERLVFGDNNGYIYEYDLDWEQGGSDSGLVTPTGTVQAATATTLTTQGGLPTTGDGLTGLRLEVDDGSGGIQVRNIASNTGSVITVDAEFNPTPTTAYTYYIAGIPAFYRTLPLFLNGIHGRTRILHLYASYQAEFETTGNVIDVDVWAGDRADSSDPIRTGTFDLADTSHKMAVGRAALAFRFEFSNSRPDQPFLLTSYAVDYEKLPARRRE